MTFRKNGPPVPPQRPSRVLLLAWVLSPFGALASAQEPPPPTPVAAPDAPAAEPQVQLEPAPAPVEPPAEPPPERGDSRDEWADSGFGFYVSSLGRDRLKGG